MTTTVRQAILSRDDEYGEFYSITNSQRKFDTDGLFSYRDGDDNVGLRVKAMEHYDSEEGLAKIVMQNFRIEQIGEVENYFDDGLFRLNLLRILRGQDADGWKITQISIGHGKVTFCLHNPSLATLANEQYRLLTSFRSQALDLHGEEMPESDKLIAGLGRPVSIVMAYWELLDIENVESLKPEDFKRLKCRRSFHFSVWAPKPSGKYPKNRRTDIILTRDGDVVIVECSKHRRREIDFLKPTPEQVNAEEQPVIITEYHE